MYSCTSWLRGELNGKGSHRDECYRTFLSANRWIQPSPHVRAQKRGRLPHCGTMSGLTKEQSAPFSSANRRAVPYEMNPPPHTHSCINIMQLWASEKLLMQRGNPYFCQSPHLKCNQRHSGGSWNLNQHQNSRREGPGVLYCTRPAGEALISIANSINSGRGVLFISLKKKLSRGEKKANWKSAVIFMVPQKSYTRV